MFVSFTVDGHTYRFNALHIACIENTSKPDGTVSAQVFIVGVAQPIALQLTLEQFRELTHVFQTACQR